MAFKIALDAGHGLKTWGKRCKKSIDPNETREWVLNSRICEKIAEKLKGYEGYELLRVDDVTGAKDISRWDRCKAANNFGADLYLSIHHNAGIYGGSGGGIVAYVKRDANAETLEWQKQFYNALIAHTGLKGNRATPLAKKSFDVLAWTNMNAVLVENGFMDSTKDTPIILTEEFADKAATAYVEVLAQIGGLVKTAQPPEEEIHAIYKAYAGKWWSEITDCNDVNTNGYAGVDGRTLTSLMAKATKGTLKYRVHLLDDNRWLNWITGYDAQNSRTGYAGNIGEAIDAVQMQLEGVPGYEVMYRVSPTNSAKWYGWCTGLTDATGDGYAGVFGKPIDIIQIKIVKK